MNNISLKLALASIKKEKKQYFISLIVMILSFTIVIAFYNALKNDQIITQKTKEKLYGNWNICYEDIKDQELEIIKNLKDYESITDVEFIDALDNNEQIANYNKDFFQLASIELTGNVPQNHDEIIVKKHLGKIGETIELVINSDVKQYKIVGIMNDYDQKWCLDAYDYFTYQLTPAHHRTYIKANIKPYAQNDANYITNVLLEDISQLDIMYTSQEHTKYVNSSYMDIGDDENTNTMNTILVFAIIGLLVGIGYTMTQRKERLFLLKSLGMSNRQMIGYIFYETVCLAAFSLIISFVSGFILSWLMSMVIAYATEKYYFSFHLFSLIPYIGILFLMILMATYFSYMMISIQSLDSLIHRKKRTKLKKYNKAYKMNVFNLTKKEIRHHYGILSSIVLLSLYLLFTLHSFIDYSQYNSFSSSYDIYNSDKMPYCYHFNTYKKVMFDKNIIKEPIKERLFCHSYIDENNQEQEVYSEVFDKTLIVYDENTVDDSFQLCKGRMPENNHECIYMNDGSSSISYDNNEEGEKIYDFIYQIGDKISLVNQYDHSKMEYTIVGLAAYEIEDFYSDPFVSSNGYNSFMVLKDSIPQENWGYYYTFYDTQDLSFYLNSNYDDFTLNKHYTNQIYTKSLIKELLYNVMMIIVEIIFLILILKIFIEKMIKDLKLLRCLGMTDKQTWQMNLYILGFCVLIVSSIYCLYGMMAVKGIHIIVLIGYVIIMSLVFLTMIHYQLQSEFTFLPSDVHRYY